MILPYHWPIWPVIGLLFYCIFGMMVLTVNIIDRASFFLVKTLILWYAKECHILQKAGLQSEMHVCKPRFSFVL